MSLIALSALIVGVAAAGVFSLNKTNTSQEVSAARDTNVSSWCSCS